MPVDFSFLTLTYQSSDSSRVLEEYVEHIANKKLLAYKHIIHTGGKMGESLWSHLMNLLTIIEKLRLLFDINADEMRCVLLALTIHDLNKVERYGRLPSGRGARYADAASIEHIIEELQALEVDPFFPGWQKFRFDIKYLAHAHQEGTGSDATISQWELDQCQLDMGRLEGPLKFLMKAADVSDNSHSGDHAMGHEKHIRDKLLNHINAALNEERSARRYRFIGHRLAEQRGLFTNVMHNELVSYFQDTYGEESCIDLLYHPEGVDYLLDRHIPLVWNAEKLQVVAQRIGQKLANMQDRQLSQFIKPTPSGISVDVAAMQSGAPIRKIFTIIANIVQRKQYRQDWREQRNVLVRNDLETFLSDSDGNLELKERVTHLLQEADLVPTDEEALKRGEFISAYRNFLKEHCADQLKAIKEEAWVRVARLFQLPETSDVLYKLVDPYRRGYFMAHDLPFRTIEDMVENALEDLDQLEIQATQAMAMRKGKKSQSTEVPQVTTEQDETFSVSFDMTYLIDYLKRHLEVWDSVSGQSSDTRPILTIDFGDSLRRYADPKRPHEQCCYCGSALKAEEWMAIQVPPNIGVQSFSNRLAGGSGEPKRNVCDVCRMQFILEKLAWRSHRDKQGSEQVTFYLHFFPYSYFTQPLLQAWWQSIERLRDSDHSALFLDTRDYFGKWEQAYRDFQSEIPIRYYRSGVEGLGIPVLSEALSNTPVLPLIVSGGNYGMQFLLALEKTAVLARWFDCRVILSRMPVPLLNLANEYIDNEPVALLVESAPRTMSWLLPQTSLTRNGVDTLCLKLSKIHQLAGKLSAKDEAFEAIIYDLVIAAADDPLALYYETDRLIEQNATRKKGKKPEYQAISLSQTIVPLLEDMMKLS